MARVGGIIVDLEGNEENVFVWGLGRATNNQYEAHALFKCLSTVDDRQYRRLIVVGDS